MGEVGDAVEAYSELISALCGDVDASVRTLAVKKLLRGFAHGKGGWEAVVHKLKFNDHGAFGDTFAAARHALDKFAAMTNPRDHEHLALQITAIMKLTLLHGEELFTGRASARSPRKCSTSCSATAAHAAREQGVRRAAHAGRLRAVRHQRLAVRHRRLLRDRRAGRHPVAAEDLHRLRLST